MTSGKTVGMLEESMIPGLTQQIKEVEELVNKLAQGMRTLTMKMRNFVRPAFYGLSDHSSTPMSDPRGLRSQYCAATGCQIHTFRALEHSLDKGMHSPAKSSSNEGMNICLADNWNKTEEF
ncbi:hypothetical protein JB92DRAFT_2826987 [Gautieria morchelliformis]|nr:hypothetical protein JB92DRAFT_2826987 [Gautieria morchelliformis]